MTCLRAGADVEFFVGMGVIVALLLGGWIVGFLGLRAGMVGRSEYD